MLDLSTYTALFFVQPVRKVEPAFCASVHKRVVLASVHKTWVYKGGLTLVISADTPSISLCCQKGTDFFDTEETVKDSKTAMALVMNQSLTPTKLDPKAPFSPSNYPDKRSVVAAYKRMVGCFQPLVEMLESFGVLENAIL